MAKASTRENELLGIMDKRVKSVPTPPKAAEQQPTLVPGPKEEAEDKQTVERVLFSLHPKDRKRIQTLSSWFAGQGVNISHSMVIRAALRVARPGDELMAAYQEARKHDKRLKKAKRE